MGFNSGFKGLIKSFPSTLWNVKFIYVTHLFSSALQKAHCIAMTNFNRYFREIFVVYSENHKKPRIHSLNALKSPFILKYVAMCLKQLKTRHFTSFACPIHSFTKYNCLNGLFIPLFNGLLNLTERFMQVRFLPLFTPDQHFRIVCYEINLLLL